MDKRFLGILVAVIIVLGGIFYFTNNHKANGPSGSDNSVPTHHVEGLGKDHVTLVEYGDYECPYCGEYYSVVKQVQQTYNTQIYFQFRNLPLTSLHPNAFAGARAAEAAGLMGEFWQMHDLLYSENVAYYDSNETTASWISSPNPEADFIQYAKQLGLNTATFKQDYESDEVNSLINADVAAFAKTGLEEATPTFLLNGKQINPTISLSSFETLINAAIKKQGFTPPSTSSSSSASTPTGSATAPKSVQK